MKNVANKLDFQLEIWTFLGPALALISFFILLVKASLVPLALPIAALIGIPLCWRWKLKGLIASLSLLLLIVVYQDQYTATEERLWNVGLALSLALAFVVTALSFEEAGAYILTLQQEASSRLNHLLQMDDKLQEVRRGLELERDQIALQLKTKENESLERETQFQTQLKLIAVIQDELSHQHSHREKLEEELFENRAKLSSAEKKLGMLPDISSDEPIAVRDDSALQHLNELIENQKVEIATLHKRISEMTQSNEGVQRRLDELSKDLSQEKEIREDNRRFVEQAQQEQLLQQAIQEEMNEHLETITREKQLLEQSLAKHQQSLDALRVQESEKEQLISSYLTTISGLQAVSEQDDQLLVLEREKLEQLNAQHQIEEKSYLKQLAMVEEKWLGALQEISQLQSTSQQRELEEKVVQTESLLEQERRLVQHTNREIRRLNGVYQQLQDQFTEKSKTLDEARRELFNAQEELAVCQLRCAENEFEHYEEELELEKRLVGVEGEGEARNKLRESELEIESLQELITSLVQVKKPKRKVKDEG